MNNIGKKIRQIRKNHGLSLTEMAKFLHVSDSTLEKYETGHSNIPFDILMRISKDSPWTLDSLGYGEIPSIDLSNPDITFMYKMWHIMFPLVVLPKEEYDPILQDVTDRHNKYLDFFSDPDNADPNMDFPSFISALRQCKKDYAAIAQHHPQYKMHAIANIISLTLFYASIVNSFFHQADNLFAFVLSTQFKDSDQKADNSIYSGFDKDKAYTELHQQEVYDKLSQYINIISKDTDLIEIGQFFSALLYSNNLVDEKLGWEKSNQKCREKMDKLIESDNYFALRLLHLFYDAYHIA